MPTRSRTRSPSRAPSRFPIAPYLFILDLDPRSLAWEYLRRNPEYRQHWKQTSHHRPAKECSTWHLRRPEDPARDARSADPDWTTTADLALTHGELTQSQSQPQFSIWKLPGPKSGYFDGQSIRLIFDDQNPSRVKLARGLCSSRSHAFQVPASVDPRPYCALISRINKACSTRARPMKRALATRPSRDSILHLRTLLALDAEAAGATHRAIAEAIFGTQDVWQRWTKDSELRAHIRYLLRRGKQLVNGGYRQLLNKI